MDANSSPVADNEHRGPIREFDPLDPHLEHVGEDFGVQRNVCVALSNHAA